MIGTIQSSNQMPRASGGTVTDITVSGQKWRVHTFTSSGSFIVAKGGYCEFLIVGGGGMGGYARGYDGGGASDGYRTGGGGGAGGVISGNETMQKNSLYTVTVGRGGITNRNEFSPLGLSSLSSLFGWNALGGGYGGTGINSGQSGACGGGCNYATPGAGLQGYGGGRANFISGYGAGGGGGMTSAGQSTDGWGFGGSGGDGIASSITGTSIIYAAGGGGASTYQNYGAMGGSWGIGGKGGSPWEYATGGSTPGSGGGGAYHENGGSPIANAGGSGANGIVIVRYKI